MKRYLLCLAALAALVVAVAHPGSSAMVKVPTGVFDTGCKFSRSLPDDPIVFPGMAGASHVHDFFANTTTDARSTGDSLLAANADRMHTTCQDTQDGAAYWTPALLRDGVKLDPKGAHVYYRCSTNPDVLPCKTFPVGFGMVSRTHVWICRPFFATRYDSAPATCPADSTALLQVVKFPQCWNGVDLHKAGETHVAFGGARTCPSGFPVRVAALELIVSYPLDGLPHVYGLGPMPDGMPMPTSMGHGDFFNAWDPDRLAHLISKCFDTRPSPMDCKDDTNR